MPPTDAVTMDNMFPRTSDVMLRKGYSDHLTGVPGSVESLMQYASGSSRKLFAAAGAYINDASVAGAVGAAVVSGATSARWQHVNFGTAGGQFLLMVNGSDTPWNYNGSTWQQTPAITGVTSSNLIHVNAFKQRIFFVEKNSMNAWYLPVSSIGGAASKLDFSSLFNLGGSLVAMGTWSLDAGSGMDDFAVWITSEGEVAVYSGTDPSSANTWALAGVYRIGKPIGRRCMVKMGGELLIMTIDGLVPISRALKANRTDDVSIASKIREAVSSASSTYSGNHGWQPILYPAANMLILNVPVTELSTSHQYVMNTITKAWCRFKDVNAFCFELFNENMYFGTSGKVCKFWDTQADAGTNITSDVKQAFSYFGRKGQLKKFNMARPVLSTDGTINPVMDMNVDFDDRIPSSSPTFTASGGTAWDTGFWDVSEWAAALDVKKNWQTITGLGYAGAIRIKFASNSPQVFWTSTDFLFEGAGHI